MNNDRIEITDEMIACYLEGNLTEEERSAVETYLSENDEAMDDLMMARAEIAYQDDIASSHSVVFQPRHLKPRKCLSLYLLGIKFVAF